MNASRNTGPPATQDADAHGSAQRALVQDCLLKVWRLSTESDLSPGELAEGVLRALAGALGPEIGLALALEPTDQPHLSGPWEPALEGHRAPITVRGEQEGYLAASLPEGGRAEVAEWADLLDRVAEIAARIRESERAEQDLLKAKHEWEQTFDAIPDLIAIIDRSHRITRVNQALAMRLGLQPRDLLGAPCCGNICALSQVNNDCPCARTLASGQPQTDELINETLGGAYEVTTAPLLGPDGSAFACVMTARDINRRLEVEKALRASEQYHRRLLETLQEGFVLVEPDTTITYVNQKQADMLGYSKEELLGTRSLTYVEDAYRETMLTEMEKRRRGEASSYEVAWRHKDGNRVYSLVSGRPLFGEDGAFKGSFAVITDISALKVMESRLMEARRLEAVGQLAAGIAHEINTPTQYIMDNTQFIQASFTGILEVLRRMRKIYSEPQGDPAELAEELRALGKLARQHDLDYLVEEIPSALVQTMQGLEHVAEIVRSMRSFTRVGHEKKILASLNDTVRNMVTVTRNEWKYVAELETDLEEDLPQVPVLPGDMNQVVINIIVNAAQALASRGAGEHTPKGRIVIGTRSTADSVVLTIADDGPGIDEQVVPHVFDPFFTTKDVGQGTGQGLALAYHTVVDKHGGRIECRSNRGSGTTIVVTLPR